MKLILLAIPFILPSCGSMTPAQQAMLDQAAQAVVAAGTDRLVHEIRPGHGK